MSYEHSIAPRFSVQLLFLLLKNVFSDSDPYAVQFEISDLDVYTNRLDFHLLFAVVTARI